MPPHLGMNIVPVEGVRLIAADESGVRPTQANRMPGDGNAARVGFHYPNAKAEWTARLGFDPWLHTISEVKAAFTAAGLPVRGLGRGPQA